MLGFRVPGRSKKLLRTVIRMQNHRHAILLCHSACMVGTADGTRNGGVELGVVLGSCRCCEAIITRAPPFRLPRKPYRISIILVDDSELR